MRERFSENRIVSSVNAQFSPNRENGQQKPINIRQRSNVSTGVKYKDWLKW